MTGPAAELELLIGSHEVPCDWTANSKDWFGMRIVFTLAKYGQGYEFAFRFEISRIARRVNWG